MNDRREVLDRLRELEVRFGADFSRCLNRYANLEFDCGETPGGTPEYDALWLNTKRARLDLLEMIASRAGGPS